MKTIDAMLRKLFDGAIADLIRERGQPITLPAGDTLAVTLTLQLVNGGPDAMTIEQPADLDTLAHGETP